MNFHRSILALVLMTTLTGACSSVAAPQSVGDEVAVPKTLRVALLPDDNASTIINNNEPLRLYLERKLDTEIELTVTTDYSSMIEAMSRGRLDLAYFGPLSYVLARENSNIEPFAALQEQEGEPPTYQAVIIGNREMGITEPSKINGQTIAWGDPASTSSHLIPKAMLKEHGMTAGTQYQEVHVGSHDAVAFAVQNGNAGAGGLSKPIFERLLADGVIDRAKVDVIQESKPYPNYPWTIRSEFPEEFKQKVRDAFINLKDETVLEPFRAAGFGEVSDDDYDTVRELGELLGLNFEEFS